MGGAKSPIDGKSQKADMNRNRIIRAVLAAGLIFVAQARADTVVSIIAETYGLQSTPLQQWPGFGTYWHVLYGQFLVPYPGPPDRSLRVYALGDASDLSSYLVDDNTAPASGVNYARLETDLNWVLGALAQAREAKMNAEINTLLGLTSGMGAQEEGESSPQYGPDDLWLSINIDTNS